MNDESMKSQVEKTKKELQEAVGKSGADKAERTPYEEKIEKDSSFFVRQCIGANELGDGLLYAEINRGRYLYNGSSGEWMSWAGHHWQNDTLDQCLSDIEKVVDRLINEIEAVGSEIQRSLKKGDNERVEQLENLQKSITKRIARLRTVKGRKACREFARTCGESSIAVLGDVLDKNPWLLACRDGVIDLETGKHRDGRLDDYITKASPVEWSGYDAKAPGWKAWLKEVFEENQDRIDFLQRLLGYAITGLNQEHIISVFYGDGRNGKGTLVELLMYILGPLAGPIPSEMLLASKYVKSASGPSPDIMSLKGLRLAFASETDDGQKFSSSKVKWLTGGDQLIGRNPHDKYPIRFDPTHTLFLLTNFKPQAPADDFAFWERMLLIPFNLSFVDREPVANHERRAKKGIVNDLKKEAPGILAWLVRGCRAYQKDGLNPPDVVRTATAEYRREEDLLGEFITDRCKLGDGLKEQSKTLYDGYKEWYHEAISEKYEPSHKKFGKMMLRRFDREKERGVYFYLGLELVS